jgi:uncharacterized protein involved in oxidation of intracellular sulfur
VLAPDRVFLSGDAVGCAVAGQRVPEGSCDLERMVRSVAHRGGGSACRGTCLGARGIGGDRLVEGARRSSMEELTDRTLWADRVATF